MKEIKIQELDINAYKAFDESWALLSAGKSKDNFNTTTISWGHLGSLWENDLATAIVYIRPSRYTKKFVDSNDYFSLSFFGEKYRKDLIYLGSHSGKDEDKVSKTSLTVVDDDRAAYFKEANIVIICRKLYAQELKEECFIDKDVMNKTYPLKDFHTMYIGKIEKILINQ